MGVELSNYSQHVVATGGTDGVTGNMVIVRKTPANVSREEKVQLKVGDLIAVTWVHGPRVQKIPVKAEASSDSDVISFSEMRRMIRRNAQERGVLMAFFVAKGEGSARLTLTIHERNAVTSLVIEAEVSKR